MKIVKVGTEQRESQIQVDLIRWWRQVYAPSKGIDEKLLFSVPNEGANNPVRGKHLKDMGLLSGVSDLILFYPGQRADGGVYHALCLELKRAHGVQSASQKQWEKLVTSAGYAYTCARGLEQAQEAISSYIEGRWGIYAELPLQIGVSRLKRG